ncbi:MULTISPECIES: sugar ABC transporter permease [unclassified Actinomyces]|uniref:carbohydrate ABC transporter permease n=1 Tax=unclassified Actinomyces TaxID=2609248 RepID=UPI00201713D6|nr:MULTISPECIES: sugar ABC transporter permease [unclassified Actinomyces]MCL3777362.1 sugar ABC transporter permease [Actinomyces sp. AC-20-1]MCL3789331.1 sugar ABC transporter permease [Actinomyces sp. 187325]MCL3792529.1 sugar ABC transporter permease [Actinomyces sp. 186855]MCL3793998.1 sugar ABC transporter permease [Actinomyces sp. 217892]
MPAPTSTRPRTAAARARQSRRRSLPYLLYLVPGALAFTVIILYPLAMNIWYSLHKWKGGMAPMRFIGLGNYAELLADERFWSSFQNSMFMIVAMVLIPTLIGLLLASVLFDYVGKHFSSGVATTLRAMYYLPQILPVAVAGIVWNWILNSQTGALNSILRGLGVDTPPNWLGSTSLALPSVMLVLIWIQIGYPTVIFMSALQRVDPELYEAAELDGAGWFARFRAITIPQIKPETFVIVLTCTIAALKVFAPVYVLTRGGPESSTLVPSYYSYLNFFDKSKVGYGAAVSTVLTLVIIVVAGVIQILQNRSARREEEGR